MSHRTLAEALLRRMDVDPSLVGDLLEQLGNGRSSLWLWRQALLAIVVGNATTIWKHKFIAARAVIVSWVVWSLWRAVTYPIQEALDRPLGVGVGNYLLTSGHDSLRWIFIQYQLYSLHHVVFSCGGLAAASWVVGRTHRSHQAAMVLFNALYVNICLAYFLIPMFRHDGRPMYFWMPLLGFVLATPCMLIAGLSRETRVSESLAHST